MKAEVFLFFHRFSYFPYDITMLSKYRKAPDRIGWVLFCVVKGVCPVNIIYKKITDIKPYEKNPRRNDQAVQYVAESIRVFGWKQPIVIDKDKVTHG